MPDDTTSHPSKAQTRRRAGKCEEDDTPDLLLLDRDFGFSVGGVLRVWEASKPVTNRQDIEVLLEHAAPCRRFKEILE